jgi:hypothetical protein
MTTGRVYYGKETLRRFLEDKPKPRFRRLPWLVAVGVTGGLFVTALAVAVYGG